jgi:hypothetical protein
MTTHHNLPSENLHPAYPSRFPNRFFRFTTIPDQHLPSPQRMTGRNLCLQCGLQIQARLPISSPTISARLSPLS